MSVLTTGSFFEIYRVPELKRGAQDQQRDAQRPVNNQIRGIGAGDYENSFEQASDGQGRDTAGVQ